MNPPNPELMSVSKEFCFESSHILPWHPGKCRNLHGHSWRLWVELKGKVMCDAFVMDFYDLGQMVSPIVDALDHNHLNWLFEQPSSELICYHLGAFWSQVLDRTSLLELKVRLSETRKTFAERTYTSPVIGFILEPREAPCGIVKPDRGVIKAAQSRFFDGIQASQKVMAQIRNFRAERKAYQ